MGFSAKDLENVGTRLERNMKRRSEERAEALVRQHGILGLGGLILLAPVRIGLFLGGVGAAFALGFIFAPRVFSVAAVDDLVLVGGLTATAYWFFVMRKFPLLAPLFPMGILLWILLRGGI